MATSSSSKALPRPPVVVVMGHVDHGKTTLLDYIRKANVAAREAGGITQSIGAYEITHAGKRITFIDTPGHEAFSKMRARGAKIADIAIVVIAADEGIKPQTLEAIKIVEQSKIRLVIAINKIDKSGVSVDKVKNDLTAKNILLEGYGGSISYQPISAKTGEGVPELLDLILLTAEVEGLTYNPSAPGKGFVLESKMESRRGPTAVVIVKDGTLKVGDDVVAGSVTGKIKGLESFTGEKITQASPSAPISLLGFLQVPQIGDEVVVGGEPGKASVPQVRQSLVPEVSDKNTLNLILKGDVSGSLEVLSEVVRSLPDAVHINLHVISESVGDISDGDVKAAAPFKALILGFNVKLTKAAEVLAKAQNVLVVRSEILYELIQAFQREIARIRGIIIRGDLEILALFGKKGGQQVIGGKVVAGEILNNAMLKVQRLQKDLGEARVINLQEARRDVQTVLAGKECGLLVTSEVEIKVGDHLILI